ncbi:MAG: 50S ribosomal protein L30 [Gammaproteobacteria bacterium]
MNEPRDQPAPGRLRITLRRSTIGRLPAHKACVTGLGLRRIGHSRVLLDTPEIRGMIRQVDYLLELEEI